MLQNHTVTCNSLSWCSTSPIKVASSSNSSICGYSSIVIVSNFLGTKNLLLTQNYGQHVLMLIPLTVTMACLVHSHSRRRIQKWNWTKYCYSGDRLTAVEPIANVEKKKKTIDLGIYLLNIEDKRVSLQTHVCNCTNKDCLKHTIPWSLANQIRRRKAWPERVASLDVIWAAWVPFACSLDL